MQDLDCHDPTVHQDWTPLSYRSLDIPPGTFIVTTICLRCLTIREQLGSRTNLRPQAAWTDQDKSDYAVFQETGRLEEILRRWGEIYIVKPGWRVSYGPLGHTFWVYCTFYSDPIERCMTSGEFDALVKFMREAPPKQRSTT